LICLREQKRGYGKFFLKRSQSSSTITKQPTSLLLAKNK